MKLKGISDAGMKRVAQMVGDDMGGKAVQPFSEGDKPKVQRVEKDALNRETGDAISYDDFLSADASTLFSGAEEMTGADVAAYILDEYGENIGDYLEEAGNLSVNDVEDVLHNHLDIGTRGNTYNWSWWGPTIQFTVLGPAADQDPYGEGVMIVSMHLGGDVRGNYANTQAFKLSTYAEEAPWYVYGLCVYITTDRGKISLDSEDDEAYRFFIHEDETDTWEDGTSITYEEIDKMLEWTDPYDLWA